MNVPLKYDKGTNQYSLEFTRSFIDELVKPYTKPLNEQILALKTELKEQKETIEKLKTEISNLNLLNFSKEIEKINSDLRNYIEKSNNFINGFENGIEVAIKIKE